VTLNSSCSTPRRERNVLVASPKSDEPDPLACSSSTAIRAIAVIISIMLNVVSIIFLQVLRSRLPAFLERSVNIHSLC